MIDALKAQLNKPDAQDDVGRKNETLKTLVFFKRCISRNSKPETFVSLRCWQQALDAEGATNPLFQ